jgi:hypothetical protein
VDALDGGKKSSACRGGEIKIPYRGGFLQAQRLPRYLFSDMRRGRDRAIVYADRPDAHAGKPFVTFSVVADLLAMRAAIDLEDQL